MADIDGFSYFMERARSIPLLTPQQEIELANRVQAGDHSAKQKLVEHNIRLAVSVARRWQNSGVPFEDLVQEAVIGLNRAAEKFDPSKGFKFSTYSMWWIRHMIQRAVHKDRATIRVPGHILERRRRIDKYMREHPEADLEEVSLALEIDPLHVEDALDGTRVVASLDAPFSHEDATPRHDVIADDSAVDPAESEIETRTALLIEALDKLEPMQRRVIQLRWGLDGGPNRSRDEVAQMIGVRPHVVQRSQKAGIIRLRELLQSDIVDLGQGL